MLALRPSRASTHLRLRPAYADSAAGIVVITDVDTGNIDPVSVVITDGDTETPLVELAVRGSSDPLKNWGHVAFAVENAESKRPIFRLSLQYCWFGTPAAQWRPTWTQDGVNWTRAPSRTVSTDPAPGWVQWQFTDPLPAGRVHIASGPVGRQSDAEAFAAYLLANFPNASPTASADANGVYNVSPAEQDDLGRDVGEHPMFAIKLAWPGPTTDGARKRKLVLLGGTHSAGEGMSFWEMRGCLLAALSDSSPEMQAFRSNWEIYAYFNLTPNGLYGGTSRRNFRHSQDPNRLWENITHPLQEVNATRAAILLDTGGQADAMFSWHGFPSSSFPFNVWTNPENVNPETRLPVFDATFAGASARYGANVALVSSSNTGTSTTWAKNVLGAPLAFTIEYGLSGSTDPDVHQAIGEAWLYGVQYADSLGLFVAPPDTLAGASLITTTASGSLSTGIALQGSASSVTLADGVLTIGIRLRGDALSQAIAAAGLTTAIQLAAAAQAGASASGDLTVGTAIDLAGHAQAAALATGSITTIIRFDAAAVAKVIGTGTLTAPGAPSQLEADATVLAIAEGGLTTGIALRGAAASVVQASGTLDIALTFEAQAFVSAMAAGVLSTQVRLDAAAVASALARADLTGGMPIVPPAERTIRVRAQTRVVPVRAQTRLIPA